MTARGDHEDVARDLAQDVARHRAEEERDLVLVEDRRARDGETLGAADHTVDEREKPVRVLGETRRRVELGVAFECNLHPWMKAWVCVVDHPWFTVTGEDGVFVLQGVPPGDYVLEAWHEKFGKKTAKVSVPPGGNAEATLTFAAR